MNNRGIIFIVQKASKNTERAKKRKADKMIIRGKLSDIRLGTIIALSLGLRALGELIVRDTRAAAKRGRTSLNRGKGLRQGRSTCS
jgi:hypothetical protein